MSTSESKWVHSLIPRLTNALKKHHASGLEIGVSDARKLPYTCEIHGYSDDGSSTKNISSYQTDLLFFDIPRSDRWIPRVVVECKLGRISTHDALTYSAKAATHKHVHPYLRYGILAGEREHYAIPVRLVKHGTYFDFMATWRAARPTAGEWRDFCALVVDEVKASRAMQELLTTNRSAKRRKYHTLHRPLLLR